MTALPLELMLQKELPAATGGCQHSYGRIVLACQNTVTAIALAITRDLQASEDIAQEAFIKAWQQLNQLNNHASFLPWLRQITRNLARDWLRANRSRPLTGEAAEIAIGMAADPSPSASERLQRVQEELAAEDIISALPEESRETLLLYYREGQSSQQVAALLGLSDAAVRKRLSRARASVREEMLHRFGEFARGSAPGTAFAAVVASLLMVAAPGTAGAVVIGSGIGMAGAGKLGAGGLGASTASGGAAAGSLGAAAHAFFSNGFHMGLTLGCVIGGMLSAYVGGLYLLRYAESPDERQRVRHFIRLHTLTAAVFCISALATVMFGLGQAAGLVTLVVGLCAINYQYLVTLPRIMAPMLARDAARHGRHGPSWVYRSLFGRGGVVAASVLVIGAVLLVQLRQ
ncbi:sigma-70 family RNA polymerase sigma factor [Flavobacterium sp. MXW15]|uniref:RNA polymerase sigma factor n=1 Tax=Xanthomonas chitinilytica TaxID=2989819 RepID=A0ABT3JVH7_9XANT|nr:sigma-70 family RNA polymerase sigma factor [Xanthomonas sp. H13-6]MCW4454891.1 sigma-70 family RNA polymerase sigma factor [Flavobacterium sp. MXW15]MCW4472481.1 sigma-70 family RNA polymerase sigma factor [Xanthomonas sp. H13-6]